MKRLLPSLVALAFAATACSDTTEPFAAKVNDQVITVADVNRQTKAVLASPGFVELLDEQLQPSGGLQPGGANTVSTEYTSNLLYEMVLAVLVDEELKRNNVDVPDSARAATEASLRQQSEQPGRENVFDALSPDYRRYVVDVQTKSAALSEFRASPAAVSAYYEQNKNQFEEVCFRQTSVLTPDQARAITARANAGQDFLALIRETFVGQQPTDAQGNPVDPMNPTCANLATIPEAGRALLAPLGVNTISDPIQVGEAGEAIIIQISSRTPQPLERVADSIRTRLGSQAAINTELLGKAEVEINPRYGELQAAAPGQPSGPAIVPLRAVARQPADDLAQREAAALSGN